MGKNEDETMIADGYHFMNIVRTQVVTGYSIIEVLHSVVVFHKQGFAGLQIS